MTRKPLATVVGLVPSGASGVRDYGRLLAEELCRQGILTDEMWLVSDGRQVWPSLMASRRLLRWALSAPDNRAVLWQYSAFAYTARGVPLPGVLFGLVLRLRRVPVVTVLHELAYPWGRRGWRGLVIAVGQRVALGIVLAGSSVIVVTTEHRKKAVQRPAWNFRGQKVHALPVFSTMGVGTEAESQDSLLTVGVIGYSGEDARPALFFAALPYVRSTQSLRIVLLGAPGPRSADGRRWMELARIAGVADLLEFTGVVSTAELRRRMSGCDVVVLVDEEGPSSRRTMLAGALAHGRAIVATDGSHRWERLVEQGAIVVVPPRPADLGLALRRLLEDRSERMALGARARALYHQEMSIERVGEAIATLLTAATR